MGFATIYIYIYIYICYDVMAMPKEYIYNVASEV